jgi:hypothetical protein
MLSTVRDDEELSAVGGMLKARVLRDGDAVTIDTTTITRRELELVRDAHPWCAQCTAEVTVAIDARGMAFFRHRHPPQRCTLGVASLTHLEIQWASVRLARSVRGWEAEPEVVDPVANRYQVDALARGPLGERVAIETVTSDPGARAMKRQRRLVASGLKVLWIAIHPWPVLGELDHVIVRTMAPYMCWNGVAAWKGYGWRNDEVDLGTVIEGVLLDDMRRVRADYQPAPRYRRVADVDAAQRRKAREFEMPLQEELSLGVPATWDEITQRGRLLHARGREQAKRLVEQNRHR